MPVEAPAAAPAAPPNLATPRYPLLDSVRGIAVLTVFAAHILLYLIPVNGSYGPLLSRLDAGVAIFLLLSAFLLYRPYVQARFDGSPRPATVPFAARRALRILPIYWISLPIVALWLGESYVFTPDGILTYFGFLQIYDADTIQQGIGQAWTVCVEVTFYLMLPVWAWALTRARSSSTRGFLVSELAPLVAIFAFSIIWKAIAFHPGPAQTGIGAVQVLPALFTLPAFLDAFAVGMALAVVTVVLNARPKQPGFVGLVDRAPWLFFLIAIGAWWLSGIGGGTNHVESRAWYVIHQQFNIIVAVCVFLPAVFGDPRRGWVRRVLDNKPLVWLATISYGFYVWHLVIMRQLYEAGLLDRSPVLFTITAFAATAAIGAALYYTIGRYFIRLGAKLPRGGGPPQPSASGRGVETPPAPRPEPLAESAGPRGRG